mgnify:CR=1 FL=1
MTVMETRPFPPKLPEIAESEQTPLVRSLLQMIADLQAQVQRLEDEIRRLQGGPPRPRLKPNTLEPAGTVAPAADGEALRRRRRGPHRAKTAELTIHATDRVPLPDVPARGGMQGVSTVCGAGLGDSSPQYPLPARTLAVALG